MINCEEARNRTVMNVSAETIAELDNEVAFAAAGGKTYVNVDLAQQYPHETPEAVSLYLRRLGYVGVNVRSFTKYEDRKTLFNRIEFNWMQY